MKYDRLIGESNDCDLDKKKMYILSVKVVYVKM